MIQIWDLFGKWNWQNQPSVISRCFPGRYLIPFLRYILSPPTSVGFQSRHPSPIHYCLPEPQQHLNQSPCFYSYPWPPSGIRVFLKSKSCHLATLPKIQPWLSTQGLSELAPAQPHSLLLLSFLYSRCSGFLVMSPTYQASLSLRILGLLFPQFRTHLFSLFTLINHPLELSLSLVDFTQRLCIIFRVGQAIQLLSLHFVTFSVFPMTV